MFCLLRVRVYVCVDALGLGPREGVKERRRERDDDSSCEVGRRVL